MSSAAMLQAVAEGRVGWCDTAPETTKAAVAYAEARLERGLDAPAGATYAELAHCRFFVGVKQLYGDDHRALVAAQEAGLVELGARLGDDAHGDPPTDRVAQLTAVGWARLSDLMEPASVDEPPVCAGCGNDLATAGYRFCTECLEAGVGGDDGRG